MEIPGRKGNMLRERGKMLIISELRRLKQGILQGKDQPELHSKTLSQKEKAKAKKERECDWNSCLLILFILITFLLHASVPFSIILSLF
jgi:hypothetical protein